MMSKRGVGISEILFEAVPILENSAHRRLGDRAYQYFRTPILNILEGWTVPTVKASNLNLLVLRGFRGSGFEGFKFLL
jgi:hypothetical protein